MSTAVTAQQNSTDSRNNVASNYGPICSIVFWGLLTLYCVWVLWLPEFPSQDGPVHLYYTSVIRQLLSGSPLFSHFFALKLPPPPYAAYYCVLLLLEIVFAPVVAGKIVVCLAIFLLATGLRYVASAVGPSGNYVSIWVMPLTLNWMLGMGFHNYLLSLGLGLWAMGFWIIAVNRRSLKFWTFYLACVAMMVITHPVPLLVLLGLVAGEIGFRAINSFRRDNKRSIPAKLAFFKSDLCFFLFSCLLASYVLLFVDKNRTIQSSDPTSFTKVALFDFIRLQALGLTTGNVVSRLYRLAFYPLLAAALWTALRGFATRWRESRLTRGDLFGLLSIALIVVIPLLPRTLNGSGYFTDRLLIYIWITALIAAASAKSKNILTGRGAMLLAALFALFALGLSDHYVRPIANSLAANESVLGSAPGDRGLFISPPVDYDPTISNVMLSYDPFYWSAAHYFRMTNTVMLNAPWLTLPIIPLEPRGELLTNLYPTIPPEYIYEKLAKSERERQRIEQIAQFVVLVKYPGYTKLEATRPAWLRALHCGQGVWLSLCSFPDRVRSNSR